MTGPIGPEDPYGVYAGASIEAQSRRLVDELGDAIVSAYHPGTDATRRFIDAAIAYDGDDPDGHAELEAAASAYEQAWGLPPMMAVTPEEYDRMMREQGHW